MEETIQMLFTWDTQNLCIVFKSWRVTSTMSLLWSLLGVMLLTAGYELIREISRRYEAKIQREIDEMPSKCFALSLPVVYPCPCFSNSIFVSWIYRSRLLKLGQQRRPRRKLIARIRTLGRRRICQNKNYQGCLIRYPSVLFLFHHVSFSFAPTSADLAGETQSWSLL